MGRTHQSIVAQKLTRGMCVELRRILPKKVTDPIVLENLRVTFFEKAESIFNVEDACALAEQVRKGIPTALQRNMVEYIQDVQKVREAMMGGRDILTVASSHRPNTAQIPELQLSTNNCPPHGSFCTVSIVTPFGRTQISPQVAFKKIRKPLKEEGDPRTQALLGRVRQSISTAIHGGSLERALPEAKLIQWSAVLYLCNQGKL